MKKIRVEDAPGLKLAHDLTEIVPGKKKEVAFARGTIITENDLEKLLDLGKRYLFVFEGDEGGVHEEEAGTRLARALADDQMDLRPPKEGRVNLVSKTRGLFYVNHRKLQKINSVPDILVSTLPNRFPVTVGDSVAAAKITPLLISEDRLAEAENLARNGIFSIKPFKKMAASVIATGSEVYTGRVQDASSSVERRLAGYGVDVLPGTVVPDDIGEISRAILSCFRNGADLVVTTAGLSVDPDDVTKEGIEATGAKILFYGTPIFPGAMFLIATLGPKYILGAPACVYYNNVTAFDIMLPRILAGERPSRKDVEKLGYGGLCRHCSTCHYPDCFFGKGP